MATVKELQKKLVRAIEVKQDPAPILSELAKLRAADAMEADREEAQKIAKVRKTLRDRAEVIKATIAKQAAAVDEFLAYRDKLLSQLQELIEPMRELARMGRASWEDTDGKPGECYLYNDPGSFQSAVRGIPREILSSALKCPTLQMAIPSEDSFGKSTAALFYLESCAGILANFQKGFMVPIAALTDDSLLLDDEPETGSCIVCQHESREAIDKALKEGNRLRDMEAEFGVSRSSLSRHKNRCLNLGAIRVEKESPTQSANQTFFER